MKRFSEIIIFIFKIIRKIYAYLVIMGIRSFEYIRKWFLTLSDKSQNYIIVSVAIVFILGVFTVFAPTGRPPTKQELEQEAAEQAESDKQAHDVELQTETETKRQAGADALAEKNRKAGEQKQQAEQAEQAAQEQAAATNAPTILTADICKDSSLKDSLKSMLNEGMKRSEPVEAAMYGDVVDVALYHISSEVNDDNVVCTATATITMKSQNTAHAETYAGMEIGLAPGKGGQYSIRILSPGNQTM